MLKRFFTLLLMLFVLITSLPFSAFADTQGSFPSDDIRYDEVYYSDLFYTYDDSYLKSQLLRDYVKETYNINEQVYNEYCDSAEGFWTVIKTSLNAATSPKEYFKLMSSVSGGQDFTYDAALDKANTAIFASLLGDYDAELNGKVSAFQGYAKRFQALSEVLYKLSDDAMMNSEDIQKVFPTFTKALLADGNIFYHIPDATVTETFNAVLEKTEALSNVLDVVGGVYNFTVSYTISMIMEDVRLETLNFVINNVSPNSTVYDGFVRLRRQLTDGFEDYFVNQYLVKGVVEAVYDGCFKLFFKCMGNFGSAYSFYTTLIRVGSVVVFDLIFKVPDLDDMMLQYVLAAYASDLYDAILDPYNGFYLTAFDSYFSTDSVRSYEDIFELYIIATNETFKASEKITLKKNKDQFNEIRNKYSSFSYEKYIDDIKSAIEGEEQSQRKFKRFTEFYLEDGIKFKHFPDDTVEDGYFYTQYATLWADVRVGGIVNYPEDQNLIIDGILTVEKGANFNLSGVVAANGVSNYGNIIINKNASLDVKGNMSAGVSTYPYVSCGLIYVSGQLDVDGRLYLEKSSHQSSYHYALLKMDSPDAVIRIGGDFAANDYENCKITDGTVIFDGNGVAQSCSYLSLYDLEVTNPDGVYFDTTLRLSGNMNLHGNRSEGAGVQVSAGATFAEGSDYGVINIPRGTSLVLENRVKADFSVYGSLTIPEGAEAGIDGNVSIGVTTYPSTVSGYLYVFGTLDLSGDMKLIKYSHQSSYYYSYLVMSKPDSALYIGGDINAGDTKCFDITDGTIIFNGRRQQNISYLSANNVEVLNPYGIKYITKVTVKGVYDLNANPLDNNGYSTQLTSTTVISSGSDYKKLSVPYGTTYSAQGDFAADFSVAGTLTVKSGNYARIDGDVNVTALRYNAGVLDVDGELEVTGNIDLYRESYQSSYTYAYLSMNEPAAVLKVGGDITSKNSKNFSVSDGAIVFNGTDGQYADRAPAPSIVLLNESDEGVTFGSSINPKTLFDHNNLVSNAYGTFADYDGDGFKDNVDPDPKAGPDTVPEITVDGYVVSITAASEIYHIRYAKGEYSTAGEIKNASGCVNIDTKTVGENTKYGSYVTEMADGGIYSFWIKTKDGDTYIYTADMSVMIPTVEINGVKMTVGNLYGVKDVFIARGVYDSYADVKANTVVQLTQNKINNAHSYTYTLPDYGSYTVLVRYTDASRSNEILHTKLRVLEPVFTLDGLQLSVGNLNNVKVIRVAYGDYSSSGEIKRASGCRNYTGKADIKGAEDYMIQFRENGLVSVAVEYNNGYVKIYQCEITKKTPAVLQEGNTVIFDDLDGLAVIRYAPGAYNTSAEIKRAVGSKVIKPDAAVDGKISVTLDAGIYSFCVQYMDESYNYYIIEIEGASASSI